MKRNIFKKIVSVGLTATLLVGSMAMLSGCGSKDKADDGVMKVWVYEPSSTDDKAGYDGIAKAFTAETGIDVKIQYIPKDDFNEKLNAALHAGDEPDVSFLDQPRMAEFSSDGTLLDLKDYIAKSSAISEDTFFSSAFDTCVLDGGTYGVPLTLTTSVVLYNKDLVEKLISDSQIKSWKEWENVSKEVAANPSVAAFEGIATGGYASWYFQTFLCSAGGNLADGANLTFNDQHGVDACEFLKTLYSYSPEEIRNGSDSFGNGKIAFRLGGGSDIKNYQTSFPDLNLGAMLVPPQNEGDTSYSNIGGENLVIYSTSTKQDEAFQFVEYLTKKDNSQKIADYTGNFSASKEAAEAEAEGNELMQVVYEQLNTAVARPQLNGWIYVNDNYLADALVSILLEDKDIQSTLDTAKETAEAYIKSQQ